MNKIKCIEQLLYLRFSRNLRTFRMYPRLDIFNHWFHASMRLFSTVVDQRLTSNCGKDKNVAKSVKHEQEVSVSLMFLPHFLFAFIRLKQGKKKKCDKMPHNRFLSVQWISLGNFQVRNTTFRLYFSFSSLSYLWTVSPKTFLRPSLAQIRIIAQIIFKTASFS